MRDAWRSFKGVVRSLRIYYGDPVRRAAMDRLYCPVRPAGRPCVRCRRACRRPDRGLSAASARALSRSSRSRRWSGRCGFSTGATARSRSSRSRWAASRARSTCASISTTPRSRPHPIAFVRAADGAPGWEGQAWTRTLRVPVTTLDALIAATARRPSSRSTSKALRPRRLRACRSRCPRSRSNSPPSSAMWRGLRRALRSARLYALQRRAWRKPVLRPCRLAERRRHRTLAGNAAGAGKFRRRLRLAWLTDWINPFQCSGFRKCSPLHAQLACDGACAPPTKVRNSYLRSFLQVLCGRGGPPSDCNCRYGGIIGSNQSNRRD